MRRNDFVEVTRTAGEAPSVFEQFEHHADGLVQSVAELRARIEAEEDEAEEAEQCE